MCYQIMQVIKNLGYLLCGLVWVQQAYAAPGLQIDELPRGGNVTIPGDFPVKVPNRFELVVTGFSSPQSIVLSNDSGTESVVHIFSRFEQKPRKLRIPIGSTAVYSLRQEKPVRVRVLQGNVRINSMYPLRVER